MNLKYDSLTNILDLGYKPRGFESLRCIFKEPSPQPKQESRVSHGHGNHKIGAPHEYATFLWVHTLLYYMYSPI